MEFVIDIMRYFVPVATVIILATCVISLFRNRPRVHKMAQLINKDDGEIIDIDHWETSLGKSKSNDICLPYTSVSRFHAVIAKKRKDWVVTDTNSRVGVVVNGNHIDGSAVIEDGDIITIGTVSFVFQCQEAISSAKKKTIRSNAKQNASPQQRNVAYGVLVDVKSHKPIYLKKQDVLIGRSEQADIQIKSSAVSARHARIHKTSKGWALSDLDSHNGTKLNGRFINQPQIIFDEDMITFGDRVFIFYEK